MAAGASSPFRGQNTGGGGGGALFTELERFAELELSERARPPPPLPPVRGEGPHPSFWNSNVFSRAGDRGGAAPAAPTIVVFPPATAVGGPDMEGPASNARGGALPLPPRDRVC
jgi:hypothetical protein